MELIAWLILGTIGICWGTVALFLTIRTIRRIIRLSRGLKPLRIYVAGPLSHGSVTLNVDNALAAADQLLKAGYAPFVPHLTVVWNSKYEHLYERWMQYDFAFLTVCDAVVRIPGHSPGADREVALCKQRGIPVFYGVEAFLEKHGERHD